MNSWNPTWPTLRYLRGILRGGTVESCEEPLLSASLSNFELGKLEITE
jgi:hypothetical protein